jgi:hypothetical protein
MHTPNQQPIGTNGPNTLLKYPCLIFKLNRGLDIVIINTDGLQDTQLLIVLGGSDAYVNEVAKTLNLTNEDKVTDNGVATTHGRANNQGPGHHGADQKAGNNRTGVSRKRIKLK